jgi:hypothetical protein
MLLFRDEVETKSEAPMNFNLLITTTGLLASIVLNSQNIEAQTTIISSGSPGVVTVVPVRPGIDALGTRNSLGWNTGYTAITTTAERPSILGRTWGGSDTISETVTRVVPNDVLGNPVRYGAVGSNEPNSAGWNTGYSTITSTYDRPDPFGALAGGSRTVTETKTQIVPNDALGQPIRPISDLLR